MAISKSWRGATLGGRVLTPAAPYDPTYLAARRVLLDSLEALSEHRQAIVVIGAQAVYLRTDSITTGGIAAFTTDADLAINPQSLAHRPPIEELMVRAGFSHDPKSVGAWWLEVKVDDIPFLIGVDLLVPEQLAPGSGRRSVELTGHGPTATRRTAGLEATLVDFDIMDIASLEAGDARVVPVCVAGPAALMIAKLYKIGERDDERLAARRDRLRDKDAADIYRLFQAISIEEMVAGLRTVAASEVAGPTVDRAMPYLQRLFGRRGAVGIQMAARSLAGAIRGETVEEASIQYVEGIIARLR